MLTVSIKLKVLKDLYSKKEGKGRREKNTNKTEERKYIEGTNQLFSLIIALDFSGNERWM